MESTIWLADGFVVLTGEIIHNPHVNEQLRQRGVRILTDPGESMTALTPNDVVILPAFGIVSEIIPTFSRKPIFGTQQGIHRRRSGDAVFHTLHVKIVVT